MLSHWNKKTIDLLCYILLNYGRFLPLPGALLMNKTELIEAIATRSNTTKAQTATMLNGMLEVLQQSLAAGNNVQLVGFGTFSVTERVRREGRNPTTGKTITIPAKKVVKFKPGKALSEAVTARTAKTGEPVKSSVKAKKK